MRDLGEIMDLFTPYSDLLKFNPNHDERGRFSSGSSSGGSSKKPAGKKPKGSMITAQVRAAEHARRQRAIEVNSYARAFKHYLGGGASDYGRSLHAALQEARLSKNEWHQLARLTDTDAAPSWPGSRVKRAIMGRVHSLLVFDMKRQSRGGRSAA